MRPRERYRHHGPTPFGDAELLALVLGTGSRNASSLEVATSLLQRFGGLLGVALADPAELVAVQGVGPARATQVHAALHAGRRSLQVPARPKPVCTPAAAYRLLGPRLRGLRDEELHGLYLDRRRHPLATRVLTRGSDGFTVVDPRQVFRVAVAVGACGVVLAHNHPSGDPTPSEQDRDISTRVAQAGKVLGIGLLDHLVIGSAGFVSLAERGHLPHWRGAEALWMH